MDTVPLSKPGTIAFAAAECDRTSQRCREEAALVPPNIASRIDDEIARISTWVASIGVFAPGRQSVVYGLRYAPKVQTAIVGLFETLDYRIQECTCSDTPKRSPRSLS